MKRFLVLAACLLLLIMGFLNAQALTHVSDLAGVLSTDDSADLQQKAEDLYEKTGFDVILHTTNDSQGKGPKDYSFDFYHAFRDAGTYPDGALFAIMFDTRDYYEAARGTGIERLTYRESNDLAGVVQGKLSDGDYHGAMADYLRYVRRLLIQATPLERTMEIAPIIFVAALAIGLVYALILKSKLKIARYKSNAAQYMLANSLNLTESSDLFLYQSVTRTRIESSSGGGRGGGFSTGSRGGTSYGGRGGKF